MKYSLLFLSLCVVGAAHAQPTITGNSNPVGNEYYWYINAPSVPAPGSNGSGITWDFSSLPISTKTGIEYLPCPSAPRCGDYAGSTYAASEGTSDYSYWIADNNKLALNGVYAAGVSFTYSNPMEIIQYPFTYSDNFNDSFAASFLSGSYTFDRRGEAVVTADGYGTLRLPQATFNNVLRVHVLENYSDAFAGTTPYFYTTNSYYWYAPGERSFLAKHTSISINGGVPTEMFSYSFRFPAGVPMEADMEDRVALFPNPASDLLRIRFGVAEATEVHISLMDMMGRPIRNTSFRASSAGQHEAQLQTADLPTGLYLVRIDVGAESVVRKVELK